MLSIFIGLLVYVAIGALCAVLTRQVSVKGWLYQLFLVLDQAANVLLTPFHVGAWADETMSARAWRAYRDGRAWGKWARPAIDWLFAWQRAEGGHCRRAYERERARMHCPPELRA